MEYLRKLYRVLFGITATSFNAEQAAALLELIDKQEEAREVDVQDASKSVAAKVALVEKLALSIAEDEATIKELEGK